MVTEFSVLVTVQPSAGAPEEESSPQAVRIAAAPRAARSISFFILFSII
jgi:hypothetical protein